MSVLWLDYETYSDIDITKHGADLYARDPSTEALFAAWAVDGGPVNLWDISGGEAIPFDVIRALTGGEVRAHNAVFEMLISEHVLKLPIHHERWKCSEVLAYSMSFAGSLDRILSAAGMENKQPEGKRLIRKFSKPQKPTKKMPFTRHSRFTAPEDWALFVEYCEQDVKVLRKLWRYLESFNSMSQADWDLWRLDWHINRTGLPIDLNLVHAAQGAMEIQKEILTRELYRVTGLPKITSQPLSEWLGLPNFQKETKEAAYETATGPHEEALRLSLLLAQISSSSKWNAFDRYTDEASKVIRGTLQFAGASRTGRWAGRGVQIHNMKRTTQTQELDTAKILKGEPVDMNTLSTCIRGAIKAPPGNVLVVSDLAGIESVLAGYVTRCHRINQIFAEGKDVYKDLATHLFHVPYDKVTKKLRTLAKPAALGAQYMLGPRGLQAYAKNFSLDLDLDTCKLHVKTYRGLYPEIPAFWDWIISSVNFTVKTRTPVHGHGLTISMMSNFLRVRLPSGRCLWYQDPHFKWETIEGYESMGPVENFKYSGMENFKWRKDVSAHAGGLLENVIQAIARDILAVWLKRAHNAGLQIIGHVHDEIISLCPEGVGESALSTLNSLASAPISWAPGLHIKAEGYIATRYRKD